MVHASTHDVRAALRARYARVRAATEALAAPLTDEDQVVQSMPLASPTKWHRAHTTWFFETFVLGPAGIAPRDPRFGHLFNSYYDAIGERVRRDARGLLTRPTVREVGTYRSAVDELVLAVIGRARGEDLPELSRVVELGCMHEEQHQELILTDLLDAFAHNPLEPVYDPREVPAGVETPRLSWRAFDGGLVEIGARDDAPFAFDNETPRHRVFLEPFELATRLVTIGEVRAFIEAGGYDTPSLWLSDGWAKVRSEGWRAPLHARVEPGSYVAFGLHGLRAPSDDEPASHLSFWEAEAIARFLGARLPTEAEWEHAASTQSATVGHFADALRVPHAQLGAEDGSLFGGVWVWTRSAYDPYPGYTPPAGALGEYNGKFMAQQLVLRGGSCFTPRGHVRASYRNFWHPDTRFQMTGVRLARDLPRRHRAP